MILYVYTRPLYLISRVCLCVLSSFECFSFFYSRAERLSFHTTPFDFFTKRTEELRRKDVFSASSSIVVCFVVLDFLLKRLHEYDDDDARNDSSSSSNDDNDIFFFFFNIIIT